MLLCFYWGVQHIATPKKMPISVFPGWYFDDVSTIFSRCPKLFGILWVQCRCANNHLEIPRGPFHKKHRSRALEMRLQTFRRGKEDGDGKIRPVQPSIFKYPSYGIINDPLHNIIINAWYCHQLYNTGINNYTLYI
jgi:hypothetical protein